MQLRSGNQRTNATMKLANMMNRNDNAKSASPFPSFFGSARASVGMMMAEITKRITPAAEADHSNTALLMPKTFSSPGTAVESANRIDGALNTSVMTNHAQHIAASLAHE